MNSFEAKAIRQALRDKDGAKIYVVPKEYSKKHYGKVEFEVVVEFKYEGMAFLSSFLFASGEDKILKIRDNIALKKESIKEHFGTDTMRRPKRVHNLSIFIFNQIGLSYAKDVRNLPYEELRKIRVRVNEIVNTYTYTAKNPVDIYKEVREAIRTEYK